MKMFNDIKIAGALKEYDLTDTITSTPVSFSQEFEMRMEKLIRQKQRSYDVRVLFQHAVPVLLVVALIGSLFFLLLHQQDFGVIQDGDNYKVSESMAYYYPFDNESIVHGVVRLGNTLLIAGSKGNEPLLSVASYMFNSDGEISIEAVKSSLNLPDSDICGITAGGDGLFYVIIRHKDSSDKSNNVLLPQTGNKITYSILRYSENGLFVNQMELTSMTNDLIHGIAVGSNGEIALYGSSYVSLLNRNNEVVHTEYTDNNAYVLSVIYSKEGLIASVFDFNRSTTRYYLVDSTTGVFSEFEAASMNDEGLTLRDWIWDSENMGTDWSTTSPDSMLRAVRDNEDGFNRLGVMTNTQGLHDELVVNDGFRLFSLCLDSGVYKKLLQWNNDLNNAHKCKYVSRLSETVYIFSLSNRNHLIIKTA